MIIQKRCEAWLTKPTEGILRAQISQIAARASATDLAIHRRERVARLRRPDREATRGATVDYAVVAARLCALCDRMNVKAVAYDRWRMDILKSELTKLGCELPLKEFGQGFKDMAPALDAVEAELLNARLRHGGNPVLELCARHAIVVRDAAGNRKLDKSRATARIDGMVALAMALGVGQLESKPEPKYQMLIFGGGAAAPVGGDTWHRFP